MKPVRTREGLSALAVLLVVCTATVGCVAEQPAASGPTPTASAPPPTRTATPTPSPTPTATLRTPAPTPAEPAFTDCDQITSDAFATSLDERGWVGWNMLEREIGYNPFESIASGGLEGQLSCRFGAGPDIGTDNVIDLAWAPMAATDRPAAEQVLLDRGWERVDVNGVEYVSVRATPGTTDAEWVNSFLFTDSDVRWAQYQDEHDLIRSTAG